MTLKNSTLTLFASSVAISLGALVTIEGLPISGTLMASGLILAVAGLAVFLQVGAELEQRGADGAKVLIGTAVAGILCVWFWTVPARTAGLTAACLANDQMPACAIVVSEGGFAADVVNQDRSWLVYRCDVSGICADLPPYETEHE